MNNQPDATDLRAPRGYRKLRYAYQRHEEHEREDRNSEARDAVIAVTKQEENGDQKGADGAGFVEVVEREVPGFRPTFDDSYELKDGTCAKGDERRKEEACALAEEIDQGVKQSARVQGSGRPQPDDAHGWGLLLQYKGLEGSSRGG